MMRHITLLFAIGAAVLMVWSDYTETEIKVPYAILFAAMGIMNGLLAVAEAINKNKE